MKSLIKLQLKTKDQIIFSVSSFFLLSCYSALKEIIGPFHLTKKFRNRGIWLVRKFPWKFFERFRKQLSFRNANHSNKLMQPGIVWRVRRLPCRWRMMQKKQGVNFAVQVIGRENVTLKEIQILRIVIVEKKNALFVLPTDFGQSLVYQLMASFAHFMYSGFRPTETNSIVLVVP